MASEGVAFLYLVDKSITLRKEEGWKSVAIFCTEDSTANGTLTGATDVNIGGEPAGSLELTPGMQFAFNVGASESIDNLTIVSPVNCTLKLAVSRFNINLSNAFLLVGV